MTILRRRGRSDLEFALLLALPVMNAVRVNLDQHEARRVDAVLEPDLQILGPVLLEDLLVADQFGAALDSDEDRGFAKQAFAALEGEGDLGVALDVVDGSRGL